MKIQKAVSISLLLFALLLGLAACGGSTNPVSSGDSLPATDTAIPTLPPDTIVILKDNRITSTAKTFKPGVLYRLIVSNQGKKDHQFVIVSTALGGASLTGTQLKQASLAFVADLKPGQTMIVDLTFPASAVGGSYQMASYLHSDYQAGLKLPIAITH